MNPPRVVLDTNVIVSGLIVPHGLPGQVLAALRDQRFTLVTSLAIIEEALEVMQRPKIRKYRLEERLLEILALMQGERAVVVEGASPVVRLADPDDAMFLAAAVDGRADYVVSGDDHLLRVGTYEGIQIVNPAEFVQILTRG